MSSTPPVTPFPTEYWLSADDAARLDFASYWHDEQSEKLYDNEFYILDGDFGKLEKHLESTGLPGDIDAAFELALKEFGVQPTGTGIDLASGNLWLAPRLLSRPGIEKLYCLEYSPHKLLKLGPALLEHYRVPRERVVLVYGSFLDLKATPGSLDFAFAVQAFHHAASPETLLREVSRVLRKGGLFFILGEHLVSWMRIYAVHVARKAYAALGDSAKVALAARRPSLHEKLSKAPVSSRWLPRTRQLALIDPTYGDHAYTMREYGRLFTSYGFEFATLHASMLGFVLRKK
jgi:SAM-dependent methyltransferase